MTKKKILYIVNSLSKGSGVMSFVMNIYRNIDRKKVMIDFIIGTEVNLSYEEELKELGAKIYYISAPRKISIKNFTNYRREIKKFFSDHKGEYNIIHSHVPTFNFFYFPLAKQSGIKYRIVHSHSTKSSSKFFSRIRNYFLLSTLKQNANYFFACSKEAAIYLYGKNDYNSDKIYILNNAIDTEAFTFNEFIRTSIRKELNIEDKFVVGHVGRFANEKNHKYLINVFYEIKKIRSDSVLILVGDGKLIGDIKRRVDDINLTESVYFLGIRDDVNNIMQAMDVFVLPSTFEGLGIVSIEAQSIGLPCFVSDRVPKDVDLTDLVTHISLDEKPDFWAEQICAIETSNYKRSKYAIDVKNKNYDIKNQAKWLQNFYCNIKK